jgi:hypothetical protein
MSLADVQERGDFLRLKIDTGTATPAEISEYRAIPNVVGDLSHPTRCIVFPRVPSSVEDFLAQGQTPTNQQAPTAELPPSIDDEPTFHTSVDPPTGDTVTLAKPGNSEPKPSGRENLRAATVRHLGRGS